MVDFSRRLPTYAKQRFLDFLSDRFGSTGDPTFASLLEFVEREEESKSLDFGVQLMADEKSERTLKPSAKRSGNPSFNVKKTSAQFDSNGRRNNDGNFQNGNMIPAKAKPFSDTKNNDLVSVVPQCFVSVMERLDSHPKVANCQRFRIEVESRTQGSRPRTAFPRTDTLEAKDRNARGQGQGPRTKAQVLSKKKRSSQKFFRRSPKKKSSSQKFFKRSPQKNVFQKIFQALHKILTIQKIVLSSSRGQANFRGLEASRPRPRTSKCVLEDSTSGLGGCGA